MRLQPVKFYSNKYEEGVELILSHHVIKYRLYIDYLVGVDEHSVTLRYPLTNELFQLYKSRYDQLLSILALYGLTSKEEIKLHPSNLLYMLIEFENYYKKLRKTQSANLQINKRIAFLKRFRKLNASERQSCQITINFKGIPFQFENEPILSELVMNKVIGNIENHFKNFFPHNWQDLLTKTNSTKRKVSLSELRNRAVGEIATRIKDYLNAESKSLFNQGHPSSLVSLTTEQGNFIYEVLTLFDLYKPRNVKRKKNTNKVNHSEAIQMLIKRAKPTK